MHFNFWIVRDLVPAGPASGTPHPACSQPGHPEPGSSRARKRNSNKKVLENIHIQIYLLGSCVVSCRAVSFSCGAQRSVCSCK
jgi:hypothetical protein